ncbi:MAG: hypothetical protein DI563_10575 [Variovorax paradoxus]|uniref:Flagellar hook-length control protein-like C-terminal domain-containing protein n=1 Tax=Variovorax paradoxus TaxID=34073 RepID=A0A2W5QD89_VARPD|nr:MAG: hypothetical protein DI563_10575 [Variovorax paradoxus]
MSAQVLGAGGPSTALSSATSAGSPGLHDDTAGAAFADALTSARQVGPSAHDGDMDADDAAGAPLPGSAVADPQALPPDGSQASSAAPATPDPAAMPLPALALLLAQSALSSARGQQAVPANGSESTPALGAVGAAGRTSGVRVDAQSVSSPPASMVPSESGADAASPSSPGVAAPGEAAVRTAPALHTPVPLAALARDAAPAEPKAVPDTPVAPRFGAGALPSAAVPFAGRGAGPAQTAEPPGQYVVAADASRLAHHEAQGRGDMLAERFASAIHAEPLPAGGAVPLATTGGSMDGSRESDARHPASPEPAPTPGIAGPGTSGVSTSQASPAAVAGGAAEFAGALADQISWWLGQKTQGAELTVQGPAGAAVSVSVQVQGNEAHVAFRSEQAHARQLIGDSLPQLEQLLGGSGLVLGQVSVGAGTTGQQGHPAPDAGGRVRGVGAPAASAVPAPDAAAQATARAVQRGGIDVYA